MKRRMSPWGSGSGSGSSSDGAAMASGPPDVATNQEPAEVQEECSGKKKSKFQTFKKFFARKKRKDPSAAGADAGLKASQSSDNVSKTSENNTLTRSEKEKGSGSKISLGSKALSHDSVFVSDSSEANEALGASQDSIHGKVKSLQLQLKQAIKLGSPPSLMCVKRTEDAGTMSEDDGLPCSPPEYTTPHTAMNQIQRNSSISLEGIDSDDDQLSCAASSRAVSPLVVPGDFSQPASPFVCLDNSAAKHKLGLRHKACNRRKPVSRLEQKPEGGAVEEMLTTSILETETEAVEEQQQRRIEDLIVDQLKPKAQTEDDDEDEEKQKPQHVRESLLRDKEPRREEEEDEPPAEQEVSHSPDASCPPEPSLSEEEASKPSSRASSADSPRATPEPPAASREYLLDSPGFSNKVEENKDESGSASEAEDDDRVQETRQEEEEEDEEEEESSFLQEVLSSLKTPLVPLDVDTEGVVLERKEEKEEEEEMSEEVKEEEEKVDEPVGYQSSILSAQTTEEEKEADTPSWQEEEEEEEEAVDTVQEEVKGGESEAEEEEDLDVDRLNEHDDAEERQMEEAVEVKPEEEEEEDMLMRPTISQAGKQEEEDENEEEEEDTELEKEPEVEEKREEDGYEEVEMNEGKGAEEAEEAEEAMEEEEEEEEEMLPGAEEVQSAIPMQEDDEGVVLGVETTKLTNDDDDDIPAEPCDQEHTLEEKEQERFNQNSDGEEEAEEDVQIDLMDQKPDQEEDVEANQPDADQSEDDQEQDRVEIISHLDVKEVEKEPSEATEQAPVSSKPPSLSLPESHNETHSLDSGAISPSKTSTIHINLVSPSSEKTTFQLPPTAADPSESVTDSTEPNTASVNEEPCDSVEEEDQLSIQEQEATTPASVEETVDQPPCSLDQSKVRFTIAPAWQRTKSLTPPSSPPASISSFPAVTGPQSEEVEAATKEESVVKPEPANEAKAELVLSPSRMRNTGSTTAKPQNSTTPVPVKPQTSTAASTEESSVVVEGNPDNPFGVRLRKTSGLLRFSSEEENTEPSVESPTQSTSCKVESPPVSVKPSLSQPISTKPALPKKPDVTGDSGAKPKRVSDPAAGRSVSAGSESPSWISVAKQKQKIYKENSLEEITVKKEEQERKSSLPMYVSSAASKEQSNKTAESTGKVSPLDISKPSVSVERDTRRALSPPAPVPPQPSKSQQPPCPVAPKPQLPPATARHPQQPAPPQKSPPTPVPVLPKSPSCTSPTSFTKPASPSKTSPVTSPPFLPRTAPEKSATRPPGPSGQTASSQRGQPSPALPQDEPPWMALAKKKAKAWSEMPQIVQ